MKQIITILLSSLIISLLPVSALTVYGEQNFGGGGSSGGSSGGSAPSSDSGGASYSPPSDNGGSESDSSSSGSQVDEAAAAWFNEQARIKAEQEAALNALLLQQQTAVKPSKSTKKKTVTQEKTSTKSAMSDEINAMKENAASLANSDFNDKAGESDITTDDQGPAVVTDLSNAESEIEFEDPGYVVATVEDTALNSTSGSTDAAISKYIEDCLVADTSEVTANIKTPDIIASTDTGFTLSKTAKHALIAVLVVVLAIIIIVGIVIIMLRMGFLNVVSMDDYEDDDRIPVKIING